MRKVKLISLLAVCSFLINSIGVFAADAFIPDYNDYKYDANVSSNTDEKNAVIPFSDVTDEALYKKLTLLNILKIVDYSDDDGSFNGDEEISRGHFAAWALNTADIRAYDDTCSKKYYDLKKSSEYYGQICTASNRSIMIGYRDGTIRPDNAISYDEAVSVLLRIMGYAGVLDEGLADEKNLASQTGLKASVKNYYAITKQEAASLIYKALHCYAAKAAYSDNFKINAAEQSDENRLLAYYHDVYEIKSGDVTANGITQLGDTGCSRNHLLIDNEVYKDPDSRFIGMIGYRVTGYYKLTYDGDKTLLCMWKHAQVKETEIWARNFRKYQPADNSVIYNDGKRDRKIKLETAYSIIKNGAVLQNFDEHVFDNVKTGKITLVDNGSGIKRVIIESYVNVVLEGIESKNDKLIFKFGRGVRPYTFDPTDDNLYITCRNEDGSNIPLVSSSSQTFDADGNKVVKLKLPSISKGSVLSISADEYTSDSGVSSQIPAEGAKYVKIIVSTASYEGNINRIDSSEEIADISGQGYYISPYNYFNREIDDFAVGKSGTFFTDYRGELVYVAGFDGELHYGYLTRVTADDEKEHILRLNLMKEDGKFERFYTAERCLLNGVRIKNSDNAVSDIMTSAGYNIPGQRSADQVIKYRLNSSGEISEIETLLQSTGLPAGTDRGHLTRETADRSYYVKKVGDYMLTDSTVGRKTFQCPKIIFRVPDIHSDETDKYGIFRFNVSEKSYVVDVYDADEVLRPAIGVYKTSTAESKLINQLFVVNKIYSGLDEDGLPAKYMEACEGYDMVTYTEKTPGVFNGIKRGDVVILYGNEDEIDNVVKLFNADSIPDISEDTVHRWSWTGTLGNTQYAYLYECYKVDGTAVIGHYGGIESGLRRKYIGMNMWSNDKGAMTGGGILYDATNGKAEIKVAGIFDLKPAESYGNSKASKILFVENFGDCKQIIIFNY